MAVDDKNNETSNSSRAARRPKRSRSLFGPTILITIGVYLLLSNLDMLPDLNWGAAFRLWPLLLIFAGLNLIVRQIRPPIGTFLSLLVALIAVGVFSVALVSPGPVSSISRINIFSSESVKEEHVSFHSDGVSSADVMIDFNWAPAEVSALNDSNDLIAADVSYRDAVTFDTELNDGRATVRLETDETGVSEISINPLAWFDGPDAEHNWNVALNPRIPMNLRLVLGSGQTQLALDDIILDELYIDGGSGSADVMLPGGSYDMFYDVGSGSVKIVLPESASGEFTIDGGSGRLDLEVPESLQARIATEGGSGGLTMRNDRFHLLGEESNQEIWVTDGYESSEQVLQVYVDISSGKLTVTQN